MATVIFMTLNPHIVSAQSLSVLGDLSIGTGMTSGKGNFKTIYKRTPISLSTSFSMFFDDDTSIIYSTEIITELESRVSIGIIPKIKTLFEITPSLKLDLALGIHSKIAPYTLFGPQFDVSLVKYMKKFAVYVRNQIVIFPLGNDLPEDSAIYQYNIFIGIVIPLVKYGN